MDSAEPSLFDMTQRATKRASCSSESQGQTPPEGSGAVSPCTSSFLVAWPLPVLSRGCFWEGR